MPRRLYGDTILRNNTRHTTMGKIVDITNAVRTSRFITRFGQLLGMSHGDNRDLYEVFGYPDTLSGTTGFELMYAYANRQGIANRITWGIAQKCWRDGFKLLADPEDEDSEQLVDELDALRKRGLFQALERADVLNRIGRFSVLLVGVADQAASLEEPLGRMRGKLDLCYFRAFAYDSVDVVEWEQDTANPRYGLPTVYQVYQASNRHQSEKTTYVVQTRRIHWTRVVHWNEYELDNPVEGMGALEPIFNRVLDLDKACGGSAEAYFRNARGKLAYEIDKDFAAQLISDDDAKASFDEGAQKFTNSWQDHTVAAGAKVKALDTPHHSPLDTVKVCLWEISAQTGMPIRVLTGEGGGQYTGEEDQLAYNQLVADRQRMFCAARVREVLEVLQAAGALKLDDAWQVVFDQQRATTEKDQADIDEARSRTLASAMTAKSSIGGDELDTRSLLDELGLTGVKLVAIDDSEDDLPPPPPEPGEE